MIDPAGRKTQRDHWDALYAAGVSTRLPSALHGDVRNFRRLMRARVGRGTRVLELGCAPGKYLAWLAKVLGADVAGIDYAPSGIAAARSLFGALGVRGDLRCEDFFAPSFPRAAFDVVYSLGVVEHFDDPRAIVRTHVELVAPGGVALVVIPNYGGVYAWLQRRFDPPNLDLHNLDIMSIDALRRLAPPGTRAVAFAFGRASTGPVSWEAKLPRAIVRAVHLAGTAAGVLQPIDIAAVAPWLVLEIRP